MAMRGGRGWQGGFGPFHFDFGDGPEGFGRPRGRRRGRMFDSGELRLVLLRLITEEPRHGYDLIRAIEERTGVQHESPQVILLDHGRAAWSASHYAITAQAVDVALRDTRKVSGAS